MRGKWSRGGLINKRPPFIESDFFVVGMLPSEELIQYGRFDDVELARQAAKQHAADDKIRCYVYSANNIVIYSTESW